MLNPNRSITGKDEKGNGNDSKNKKKIKENKERSAMARTKNKSSRTVDKMMLDNETMSHLTWQDNKETNTKSTNVLNTLADASKLQAQLVG